MRSLSAPTPRSRYEKPGKKGKAKGKKSAKGGGGDGGGPSFKFVASEGDQRTAHAGTAPVLGSCKYIAQMWTHEGAYDPKVPPGNAHVALPPIGDSEAGGTAGGTAEGS